MKAIALENYGAADDLKVVDLPEPKVAPGEVLVRVKAAGVNPVDWKLAAGGLDPVMDAGFPLIPGWDVAGVVERTGFDAGEYAPGDEVYGYVRKDWAQNGTYAELVSAPVRTLAKKPAALNWQEAAGVPLAGLTAYRTLKRVAAGSGDTVLIHAAAGGVGSLGVQIAVALGARVIGTASERNHEFLRSLGAEPVTYGDGLADRVRQLAPGGVDAALDFVGGGAVDVSLSLVERADRVASVAEGEVTQKGGHYVWVRPDADDLAFLTELADAGKLKVHVEEALPLAEAARAWRLSQAGRTRGKIVLTV
ncbi:alcohol dehydrogenase [Streptomyces abyssalis]|uniref:Alcohol dehydrogenase n=1 Tax=Streptomyces abyssalis TaxID=933944 RepID=A0A1E7JG60_9ACTN|nr:NADP-dependent oxidoreductase [Streptomyces abyssalis]OEU85464.1 alcohol dehydrogenase [Streptomyces abyssalis]OEU93073.1 alcohol dehydrogenase [Streptomyces abyssalis]OEV27247.1 alcohol dehydrogenase [Streptomyces nanshensis]